MEIERGIAMAGQALFASETHTGEQIDIVIAAAGLIEAITTRSVAMEMGYRDITKLAQFILRVALSTDQATLPREFAACSAEIRRRYNIGYLAEGEE